MTENSIESKSSRAATGAFPGEEISSTCGYLSGYTKPRPLAEQIEILRRTFPELHSFDLKMAEKGLPEHAEGFFALPVVSVLADSYSAALRRVLDALAASRSGRFYNNRGDQINDERIRRRPETTTAMDSLAARQPDCDILLVPAQFAIRHRGRSVRRSREMFTAGEFGLCAVHVGAMVLTHPERLTQHDDLYIDCAGDEFDDPAADNRFGRTPCFCYEHQQLEFGTHWTDRVYTFNGSASAFS